MSKKEKSKEYSEKYFEVLKKFNLTPDFKLTDYEKDVVKQIDKAGTMTTFELADAYDLRPSEIKELIDQLVNKNVVIVTDDVVSLSAPAIKYIRATKEDRKTEKKFRNFLDCLNEKDLDKLMALVNSFVVKESVPTPVEEDKKGE